MNTTSLPQSASHPLRRAGWIPAALILLWAATTPCPLAAEGNPANVVVITIDTLRADHLGCYGDRSISTPNLDALARSAMISAAVWPVIAQWSLFCADWKNSSVISAWGS